MEEELAEGQLARRVLETALWKPTILKVSLFVFLHLRLCLSLTHTHTSMLS